MNGGLGLRVTLGLCLAGFVALAAFILAHAIDDHEQARYARDLRRLQTLDSGLNEAVLKARSGLLTQYDPLVAALRELHRLRGALRKAPAFLPPRSADELAAALDAYDKTLTRKDELIEAFKSENSVVQTSLLYFPVIATSLIDRAHAKGDRGGFSERIRTLSAALMLFETVAEEDAKARVLRAQEELRSALDTATALELERDTLVAIAHARVIVERKPPVDGLVREVLSVPSFAAAARVEERYTALYHGALARAVAQKQLLFALALGVIVLGLTEVILFMRRSALALGRAKDELSLAHDALAVEHEKERLRGELRNRFITMTSHEFRTPLTAIVSSAELLESFGERWDAEHRLDHVQRIKKAAGTMERMLEDVLTIGRAEAGVLRPSPSPIRLDEFCRALVETLEHSTNRSHSFRYTFLGDPDVTMDERLLQHVLGNLLGNAVKYSPLGSEIRFAVRTTADLCLFSVHDQGLGIPSAEIPTLFTSFSRASNAQHLPGTGLGLAVVKRALDVQQGTITVESELGRGTAFHVSIPRRLQNVETTLTPS
ncbi:MAG TPA: DAHL domain-containing protein [Polyangiaceae bacterium]|nr:DAHL domain-containing protein [Polyangiaceae bacterium]